MPLPIHSGAEMSVQVMVMNRLPFLADTPKTTTSLGMYTIELMSELEPCFRVDELPITPPAVTNIGDENKYTLAQRAVIADLVSVYVLMGLIVGNMAGRLNEDGELIAGSPKILTRTKAGSVEAEWEQFDIKKGAGLYTTADDLLQLFKKSAIRKARELGCIIDICDDCSLAVECMRDYSLPFVVISHYGCGCITPVPERGIK